MKYHEPTNMQNDTTPKNYNMLYQMMLEYNALDHDQKIKYMNILASWYMHEKDILNIKSNKNI
jgi:hypothetical protein